MILQDLPENDSCMLVFQRATKKNTPLMHAAILAKDIPWHPCGYKTLTYLITQSTKILIAPQEITREEFPYEEK